MHFITLFSCNSLFFFSPFFLCWFFFFLCVLGRTHKEGVIDCPVVGVFFFFFFFSFPTPSQMLACCLGQACACCAGQTLHAFGRAVPVNYPRVMHVLIFGVTALAAWLCGMYVPAEVLARVPSLGACAAGPAGDVRACLVSLVVVRAMAALAAWYGVLALLTVRVRSAADWRVRIYAELWGPKVLALAALVAVAFVLPNDVFVGYSWLALAGAAAFVLVQIVVLIDFACEWAGAWVAHMEEDAETDAEADLDGCGAAGGANGYFAALLATSGAMFLGALAIVVALYCLFTRAHALAPGGCRAGALNAFFITTQLVLAVACAVCAVLPAVKERTPDSGLLQASFVALYTAYLLLSALLSEPPSWRPAATAGTSTPLPRAPRAARARALAALRCRGA